MQFAQNKKQNVELYEQQQNKQEIRNSKLNVEDLFQAQIKAILHLQVWSKKIIWLSVQFLKCIFHVAFVGPRLVRHEAPGYYLERDEFEQNHLKQKLF